MDIGIAQVVSVHDAIVDLANARHGSRSHVADPCDARPKTRQRIRLAIEMKFRSYSNLTCNLPSRERGMVTHFDG